MEKNTYSFKSKGQTAHNKELYSPTFLRKLFTLCTLLLLQGVSFYALAQGPVVHYPFNGNLLDISGNGYHGTSATATPTTDRFGTTNGAYQFNSAGAGSVINLPLQNALKPTLPFSFSCWVRFDDPGLDDEQSAVFNSEFVNNEYTGFWFGLNNAGRVFVSYGDGGSPSPAARRTVTSNVVITPGTWYNVTAIITSASNMQLYVTQFNGDPNQCPDVTSTFSLSGSGSGMDYNGAPFTGLFGRTDATTLSAAINKFDGRVDDFRMWNRALTLAELQQECMDDCFATLSLNTNISFFDCSQVTATPFLTPGPDGYNVTSYAWTVTDPMGVGTIIPGTLPLSNLSYTTSQNGTYTFALTVNGEPDDGMSNCSFSASSSININCSVPCVACPPASNQITNADFSAGNTGFTSGIPASNTCTLNSYWVGNLPSSKCPLWSNILYDHTQGNPNGRYLIVDGTGSSNVVWGQSGMSVTNGTTYTFKMHLLPRLVNVPANENLTFELLVNGVAVGSISHSSSPFSINQWEEYCIEWQANLTGAVTLSLRQLPTLVGSKSGINYGIDDLYFGDCQSAGPCLATLKSLNASPTKPCGSFKMTAEVSAPGVSATNASHSWSIENSSGVTVYNSGNISGFPSIFVPHVNAPPLATNGSYLIVFEFTGIDGNGQICTIKKTLKVNVKCHDTPPVDCTEWPKGYGVNDPITANTDIEKGDGLLVDQDENVYVHGRVRTTTIFDDGSTMSNGTFLAKYDSCGTLLWVNDVTNLGEKIRKIEMDGNGDIILLAWTGDGVAFSIDNYYLSKINQNGVVQWTNTIQHKYLPWPSFDVDDNTNQIYMALNLNQALKFQDQTGTNVIDITTATSPQTAGMIVRVSPTGFVTYQEHVLQTSGYCRLQDVVVAENNNRVYFTGVMKDFSAVPSPSVTFTASGNVETSTLSNDVLLVSYSTNSFVPLYSWSQTNGTSGFETAMQLAYSDASNQLILLNWSNLSIFSSTGATIGTTTTPSGVAGRMRFNEQDNYILLNGTTSCNELRMAKYSMTALDWQFIIPSCGTSKAYVFDANFSPLNDRIYYTGTYWQGDMNVFGTTLTLEGGRDAFISRIVDEGTSVVQKNNLSPANDLNGITPFEESEISLFPNPVVNELNIALPNNRSEEVTITLFDATGKRVQQELQSGNSFRLNTSELSKGMYHVKVTSPIQTWDSKFVK
ncbi:MAG: LamG-like jellyroll fold domain-containing protein [Crocinitomicaceae bacterium]